jgi:diaminohydroxyphosphoribosylaminopyrimidine deaminase/5-amino-6-(5-phosphoribosylamino)uracil reductase
MSQTDQTYMARAIQLARQGWYTTMPNPRVGCVIVRDNEIVGEAAHLFAGEGHAEIIALAMAGELARGATAYVTLEPCSHHGKTPPCSEALIDAGIGRLVVAMQDPNPQVAGQGLAACHEAGIEVINGVMTTEAEALNPGFIKRMREGLPRVVAKVAMSLDGRTAMASGESKWITSAEARRDVHLLRAASGAILTGSGTLRHDDPRMDVRLQPVDEGHALYKQVQLARARMLANPESACVFTTVEPTADSPLLAKGVRLIQLFSETGKVDSRTALSVLAEKGINDVLVEAGATLLGSLLADQLIDELVIYMAPVLMGDMARGLVHIPGLDSMADKVELNITDMTAVGRDWRITAQPVYK